MFIRSYIILENAKKDNPFLLFFSNLLPLTSYTEFTSFSCEKA